MTKRILILSIGILLIILSWKMFFSEIQYRELLQGIGKKKEAQQQQTPDRKQKKITLETPEISGWIAYWKEADGYGVVERHASSIAELSPEWFRVSNEKQLIEVGKADKVERATITKQQGLMLYPMLATDLSDKEIAALVNDTAAWDTIMSELIEKLEQYHADGLDLDFENISQAYTRDFSFVVKTLSERLKEHQMKLVVTVQARTGENDWQGISGQDLLLISKQADQVRVMIYDKHGPFSDPGPVTPMDWFQEVVRFCLQTIPRDKIVIALPTYGYVWNSDGSTKSYQFQDFIRYTQQNGITLSRDPASSEMTFQNDQSTGWLSDAAAVGEKMKYARSVGLNKFIIWNFGGTDESLFETEWGRLEVNITDADR